MDGNQEVLDLQTLAAQYGIEEAHVFAEPWQARAFALALSLSERGLFSLRDFQVTLIRKIGSFEKGQCIAGTADYYTRWLEALEDILLQKSLLPSDRLTHLERHVIDDAESRKLHQRMTSRDENGSLKIAPLFVDSGSV